MKTLIIVESTKKGVDRRFVEKLFINKKNNCEIHTTEDKENNRSGSIYDVLDYLKNKLGSSSETWI